MCGRELGFEILTGLLKRSMYKEHPEVTTPGVWSIREGSVVTLTLDRDRGEVTFEVDDTPPFTLYNVSVRKCPPTPHSPLEVLSYLAGETLCFGKHPVVH